MAETKDQKTIDINYIKSNDYREVACDGAIGGATPSEKLWVAFYTERLPLPRIARHELISTSSSDMRVDPDKPPLVLDGRAGIVRNVEFGLYLTRDAARTLHAWLGSQIEFLWEQSDDANR
jgi:hypothetical protein